MMSFRRSRNSLRPISRIKHVIDSQSAFTAGTAFGVNLIKAVDSPVLANTSEVETGSTVNGIYLKVEAYATSTAALANFYLIIYKNPGGNITAPTPNTVGANDNKRYVIHQEMVMFQDVANSNPRTIFNGVIVIPKGMRRFAPNDLLEAQMLAPGVNGDVCLQCHYKEFH